MKASQKGAMSAMEGKKCSNPKCRRAGRVLPLSEFGARLNRPSKRKSWCRECEALATHRRRLRPGAREQDRDRERQYSQRMRAHNLRLASRPDEAAEAAGVVVQCPSCGAALEMREIERGM